MTLPWETVHIFISSTFNDMHAERDYLVKQVFPELREWCEKRKLRLVDIDLRWGVTEQDATSQNVVKVCLDRINDCRPFFLCFLGQRRGWVPKDEDISPATKIDFPALKDYAGKVSVTEMEILHALVDPLHRGRVRDPKKPGEFYEPSKHAFFFLREDSYLDQLPSNPPQLRQTYTNEGVEKEEERLEQDQQLKRWREVEIPATKHPVRNYHARWDIHLSTPELLLPLKCPTREEKSIDHWQNAWQKAGVTVTGIDVEADPSQAEKAHIFNKLLSTGRLVDFQSDSQPLSQVILAELQAAIEARFPEHIEVVGETDLQKELDQQEQFLYSGSQGFIERGGDFDDLDAYVNNESNQLFVLTAPGGMGKSSLLAKWVDRYRTFIEDKAGYSIHFRFIGQSDRSTTAYSIINLLMRELKEIARKLSEEIPDDPQKLRQELPKLLETVGIQGKTVIVLDALNQLETGLSDLTWLPYRLPKNIKLIVSFKRGEPDAEDLFKRLQEQAVLCEVRPFENLEHRRELVNKYLEQYLKQLDQPLLDALIQLPGAYNPLYLKVVLSELRVFGAFANLGEKIRSDFGETPVSAFTAVLNRLENDPAYSPIDPKQAVPLMFGLLAHARFGLSAGELCSLLRQVLGLGENPGQQQATSDTVQLYLRQVRPFLAQREGRYDFFFESFKMAVQERYVGIEAEYLPCRPTQEWHRLLAEYFSDLPTWEIEAEKKPTIRKVSELPYQLAYAGMTKTLSKTLTTFSFLQAKLIAFVLDELIEDYDLALSSNNSKGLSLIRDALRLSAHVLRVDRAQLASQLLGRLLAFEQPEIQYLLEQANVWADQPWMRPMSPCLTQPEGAEFFTFRGQCGAWAITPDGQAVVTGSLDNSLRVLDLINGTERFSLRGHTEYISDLAITTDGKLAVSASRDKTLKVWDLENGTEHFTLRGHSDAVKTVAITPDGQLAVSGSSDHTLKVWNLKDGSECFTLTGHSGEVGMVAITSDGRQAVSSSWEDDTFKVWDLIRGSERLTLDGNLYAVATTPNGPVAVSGENDWKMKTWDLEKGKERFALPGHSLLIYDCVITPDGHLAASGSQDKTLKVWDLESGKMRFDLVGHSGYVTALAITPDGRFLASGSFDTTIKVWDLETGNELFTLAGHSDVVSKVAISPNGRLVVSSSSDNTLKVWNLESDSNRRFASAGHWVNSVAVTPDGHLAVSGSADHTVKVWDLENGNELFTLAGHTDGVIVVAITPNGRFAISGSNHNILKVWDLETGAERYTLDAGWIWGNVTAVVISPDGRLAVTIPFDEENEYNQGLVDYNLSVWDLANGQLIHTLHGHLGSLNALALSPDGRLAVSGSQDQTLQVWDLVNGEMMLSLVGHTDSVSAVAVTPDGRSAVSASADRTLKVWDLESGIERFTLTGHSDEVNVVVISPDGQLAISGSEDNTLRVWDLDNGSEQFTLNGHSGGVDSVTITPDGRLAVSGSRDETLKVWDLQQGVCMLTYDADGQPCKPDFVLEPFRIVVGTRKSMHFLVLEGLNYGNNKGKVPLGPPQITAFSPEKKQAAPTFGCPFCRTWSEILNADLGKEIPCPTCKKTVKLNLFTLNGNWRRVAEAWKSKD